MRVPRVSIRELVMMIAILAVDLAAIATWSNPGSWREWERQFLLEMLPAFNVLATTLVVLVNQLNRRGECAPFLAGFQAAGWMALAVALVSRFAFDSEVDAYERWSQDTLSDFWFDYVRWTGGFTNSHRETIDRIFLIGPLAALPLFLGLLAGWAASRLGIVIVSTGVRADRSRAITSRRAVLVGLMFLVVVGPAVWCGRVYGRWRIYRSWLDSAIASDRFIGQQYERTLRELQALDASGDGEDAEYRSIRRLLLSESARSDKDHLNWNERVRRYYGPAVRHPWLPIPPNPPLSPFKLEEP